MIQIFDNLLDLNFRRNLYQSAVNSAFKVGWEDSSLIENRSHVYLHSILSLQDIIKSQLLDKLAGTQVHEILKNKKFDSAVINLSKSTDTHWCHTHPGQTVLLYYINLEWQHAWAGETLFYNDELTDITRACVYTPGRIIVFDGEIPHTIRPQSAAAPQFRFTLSVFFNN